MKPALAKKVARSVAVQKSIVVRSHFPVANAGIAPPVCPHPIA